MLARPFGRCSKLVANAGPSAAQRQGRDSAAVVIAWPFAAATAATERARADVFFPQGSAAARTRARSASAAAIVAVVADEPGRWAGTVRGGTGS